MTNFEVIEFSKACAEEYFGQRGFQENENMDDVIRGFKEAILFLYSMENKPSVLKYVNDLENKVSELNNEIDSLEFAMQRMEEEHEIAMEECQNS